MPVLRDFCAAYGNKVCVNSKETLALEAIYKHMERRVINWNFPGVAATSGGWTASKPMFREPSPFPWWRERRWFSKQWFTRRSTTYRGK